VFSTTEALEAAYRSTTYFVCEQPEGLSLRIGEHSQALDRLLSTRGVLCAAYITACNPMSRPCSRAYNKAAARKLASVVVRRGWSFVEGEGRGQDTKWPPEQSLLVLGISRAEAHRLAVAFRQNAFVFARRGRPAELVWAR
jgi:hypothetical protein